MNHPELIALLADIRVRELRAEAARDRLARIAVCCRPGALVRRVAALRGRFTVRTELAACCA